MGHCLTHCLQKIPQRLFQSSEPVTADCCWVDPFASILDPFASILANVVSAGGFGVCACCRRSGGVVGTVPGAACGEKCASFYVLNLPFYHSFHPIQTRVSCKGRCRPKQKRRCVVRLTPRTFAHLSHTQCTIPPLFYSLLRKNVAGRAKQMMDTMPV